MAHAEQQRPLVGRDAELAGLRAALDATAAGTGRLLLLAGEPGIGKTRLAEEIAAHARGRGMVALWGRCEEASGAPAYWPWVQMLRGYTNACADHLLAAQLGAGAAQIAQILPELRERLPEHCAATPALSPESARFALFDAVAHLLMRASAERPLLLVMDDLHAADAGSLLLLRFVASQIRSARMLLIAAYRDVEAVLTPVVADRLDELLQEAESITLAGLALADLTRMIERTYGVTPTSDLVIALHEATRGNPFFAHLLLANLFTGDPAPERRLERVQGMPVGVHEAIRQRLELLGNTVTELLSAAAVSGDVFDVDVLERVLNRPRRELVALLEERTMARVVSRVHARPGRYTFAHALVREAVYRSLTVTERAALHRRIVDAIESVHSAHLGPYLGELAHHSHQAIAGGGDVETAVAYTMRAAEWAAGQLAYEQAAAYYERALHTLESIHDVDQKRRFDLLLAVSRMLNAAGRSSDARVALRTAAELARRLEDAQRLAHTALAFGIISTHIQGGMPDSELIDLLIESRAGLGPQDAGLRAMVLARLVYELQLSGEPARIRSMAHEAVATARDLGDQAILAYALMWAEPGLGWVDLGGRFARGAEMIRIAEPHQNAELAMMGHIRRVRAFLECSDLSAADAEAAELGRVANHARLLSYRWWLSVWKAQRAAMLGHFEQAERLSLEAFEIGQVFNREGAEMHRDIQLMIVCRDQGRYDELDVCLQRQLSRQVHPSARCLACLIDAERQRTEPAKAALEQLGGSDFSRLRDDPLWLHCAVLLAETCSLLGDTARAERLYARLVPYSERCVFPGVATAYHGNVARYLGQLATTLRRWPEATEHFEAALRIDRRMGTQPWLARAQYDYARMLRARGGVGDRAGSEQLCAQALQTAQALGMRPLAEAITASAARQAVSG